MSAYLRGISFRVLNPERRNQAIQALVRGVSFLVSSKALYLKVLRWNGSQYVPVPGVTFDVLLQTTSGNVLTEATTAADGTATLNLEAATIQAAPRPSTIPTGYRYTERYRVLAKGKNYLTITLLPTSIPECPIYLEVL